MEKTQETAPRDGDSFSGGQQKLANLQALRGLAILLVVLLHLSVYDERIFKAGAMLPNFAAVGRAGVDLFFAISGFVMVLISRGRFQTPGAAGVFLVRRIARIYPLYWIFTLLYVPVFWFRPEMMTRPEGLAGVRLLPSFLLLPQRFPPLLGQAWTLIFEMYFYIGFALLLFLPERKKGVYLLRWAIFVGLGSLAHSFFPALQTPVLQTIFSLRTLEFLSGCALALWLPRGLPNRGGWAIGLGLAVLVLAASVLDAPAHLDQPGSPTWPRIFAFDLASVLLITGAVGLEQHQNRLAPKWLCGIGEVSYSIYLSHILVLSLALRVWTALNFRKMPLGADMLFVLAAFLGIIVAGGMIHHFLEKPLLKLCYGFIEARIARKAARNSPEAPPEPALSGSTASGLSVELLQ